MDMAGPGLLELIVLELEKNSEFDFVNTLASTNINQPAPYLVEMCATIMISDEFDFGSN